MSQNPHSILTNIFRWHLLSYATLPWPCQVFILCPWSDTNVRVSWIFIQFAIHIVGAIDSRAKRARKKFSPGLRALRALTGFLRALRALREHVWLCGHPWHRHTYTRHAHSHTGTQTHRHTRHTDTQAAGPACGRPTVSSRSKLFLADAIAGLGLTRNWGGEPSQKPYLKSAVARCVCAYRTCRDNHAISDVKWEHAGASSNDIAPSWATDPPKNDFTVPSVCKRHSTILILIETIEFFNSHQALTECI